MSHSWSISCIFVGFLQSDDLCLYCLIGLLSLVSCCCPALVRLFFGFLFTFLQVSCFSCDETSSCFSDVCFIDVVFCRCLSIYCLLDLVFWVNQELSEFFVQFDRRADVVFFQMCSFIPLWQYIAVPH